MVNLVLLHVVVNSLPLELTLLTAVIFIIEIDLSLWLLVTIGIASCFTKLRGRLLLFILLSVLVLKVLILRSLVISSVLVLIILIIEPLVVRLGLLNVLLILLLGEGVLKVLISLEYVIDLLLDVLINGILLPFLTTLRPGILPRAL